MIRTKIVWRYPDRSKNAKQGKEYLLPIPTLAKQQEKAKAYGNSGNKNIQDDQTLDHQIKPTSFLC